MDKFQSFMNDTLAALNESTNRKVEQFLKDNQDKYEDPVLCMTEREYKFDKEKYTFSMSLKVKLMERRDIPPLVEVCDE